MNIRRKFPAASGPMAAPMNEWLVLLDASVTIPLGNGQLSRSPGFATLGDDFHDAVGSRVEIHSAALDGDHLTITGAVTESKNAGPVGQAVRIEGKEQGTSVAGLTATIGRSAFNGAGLILIVIIAILAG